MLKTASLSIALFAAAMLSLSLVVLAQAAYADNDRAALVHVGQNPNSCGTIPGRDRGVVTVHFSGVQKRFKVDVSVHDALPNTTYVVDVRCVGAIGSLTTNSRGTGRAQIDLSQSTPPSSGFFIDISVPNGVTYGDTFIAGPFDLN
jgi:hypothetical protein